MPCKALTQAIYRDDEARDCLCGLLSKVQRVVVNLTCSLTISMLKDCSWRKPTSSLNKKAPPTHSTIQYFSKPNMICYTIKRHQQRLPSSSSFSPSSHLHPPQRLLRPSYIPITPCRKTSAPGPALEHTVFISIFMTQAPKRRRKQNRNV